MPKLSTTSDEYLKNSLSMKPFIPKIHFQGESNEVDGFEHSPYDYENDNDILYCSQNNVRREDNT